MSIDNESAEPGNELGLSLGHSDQRIERRFMSSDSGAGANAGSGIHMTFFATNPLSELVWSPLKGPSNVALLPSQSMAGKRFGPLGKRLDGEDFLTLSTGHGVGRAGSESRPGISTNCVVSVHGPNHSVETGNGDNVGVSALRMNRIEELGQGNGNGKGKRKGKVDSVSNGVEFQLLKITDPRETQLPSVSGQVIQNPVDISSAGSDQAELEPEPDNTPMEQNAGESGAQCARETEARSGTCIGKTESTSENDLSRRVSAEVALELSGEAKETSKRNGERALSDGDLNAIMLRDKDDSNESVESCNSARSFAAGKRRRNFDDDDTAEVKKRMRGSTAIGGRDSSFMNWISNMMKGFSQSAQDGAPVPLNMVRPSPEENLDKTLVPFNKNQEPGSRLTGFQSIFQSLYCAKTELQHAPMVNLEYQVGEGSKEVESSNKTSDYNSAPPGNVVQLNERLGELPPGNEESSAIQAKILLLDKLASGPDNGNDDSGDDNAKGKSAFCGKGKPVTSSKSSLGKWKTKSAEQVDSESPSGEKTTSKFCHGNDPLGSFWITRFSRKTPESSSHPDLLKASAECLDLIPHTQSPLGVRIDGPGLESRDRSSEDPIPVLGKESKSTSTWIKALDDSMSLNKLIPVSPFPVVRPSGAMASVFARRLDSLKHVTCFFCGMRGHDLRDCPEMAEIELDELVRNLNAYSGVEEPRCLCIRCFERNHWAVACPKAPSTKRPLFGSDKENSRLGISEHGKCEGIDLRAKAPLNWKVDETTGLFKNRCSTGLKENQIVPLSLYVTEKNSEAPKGLFDAVRGLRLSRGNILKWTISRMSISQIEGFFLRLRLGKWEEGLGGTGYCVACIIGTQKENEQDSKRSILVNVGGTKCLVESRYISNNDFLEDELKAWWSITSRNNDKIPSEEELRTKVKTKRMLGF